MAAPVRGTAPNDGWAMRLFGVETEYGFAAFGPKLERLDATQSIGPFMEEVREAVPYLPCGGPYDVFTANGSRVYIDCGLHPEVATPECSTPEEAVRFMRAGDLLLARAARAVERRRSDGGTKLVLWKANVDHRTGATWGSHESYLHQVPQRVLAEQLISHLVTRLVYTGAGGFCNRTPELRFLVSPRAMHLEHEISDNSTSSRGIFHTRDEPLATGGYRRLHVLAGESLWSETADYLRVGTTALLVAQIDAGRQPQTDLDLHSPLEALRTIAHDVSARAALRLRGGDRLTAIQIQRRLLHSVEVDLGAGHLPRWAPAVCARWGQTLDRLEASPTQLVGVLDWPTKLAVLKRQCEAQGVEWTFTSEHVAQGSLGARQPRPSRSRTTPFAARLLETDMCFNRLDDSGIFAVLDRERALSHRIVTPESTGRAVREPPAAGRARIRAACVQDLAADAESVSCTWQQIVDEKRGQRLVLGDPFQSAGEHWSPLPAPRRNRPRSPDASVQSIREALGAGIPRLALRHMRALLSETQPISRTAYGYLVSVFQSLVPSVPVPILRRGAATAGPALQALFDHVTRQSLVTLERQVGTLLYRFHEGRGAYDRARQVITQLMSRAEENGDRHELALLTTDLGYEYLLDGKWAEAASLFERAIPMFESIAQHDELPSVRANLLECHFGQRPPERWTELVPELKRVNRELVHKHDWRARKSLMLLARLAHARGRRAAARAWAKRALAASEGVPTQLHKWDRALLDRLNGAAER